MGTKKAVATAQRGGAAAAGTSASANGDSLNPAELVGTATKEFRLVREGKGAIAMVVLFGVGAAVLKAVKLEDWLLNVLLPLAATVVVMSVCALLVATLSTDRRARKIVGATLTGLIVAVLVMGTGVLGVLAWRFAQPAAETFDYRVTLISEQDQAATIDGTLTLDVDGREPMSARLVDRKGVFRDLPKGLLGRSATVSLESATFEFLRPPKGDTPSPGSTLQLGTQTLKVTPKGAFKGTIQHGGQPVEGVRLVVEGFGCKGTSDESGLFSINCPDAGRENAPGVMLTPPETLRLICKPARLNPAGSYASITLEAFCEAQPAVPEEPEPAKNDGAGGAASVGRPTGSTATVGQPKVGTATIDPQRAAKIEADCATLRTQLRAQYRDRPFTVTVGEGTLSCDTCGDLSPMTQWAHAECGTIGVERHP